MNYNYLFILLTFIFSIHAEWQEIPNLSWDKIDKLALSDINNVWATALTRDLGDFGTKIYKFENNKWNGPKGDLRAPDELSISQDNIAYALKSPLIGEKKIYEFNGSNWNQIHSFDSNIEDFSVISKNNIWITKQAGPFNFKAFNWDGKNWQQKGNENIWNIDTAADGSVVGKQIINYVDGKIVENLNLLQLPETAKVDQKINLVQWDGKKWNLVSSFEDDEYIMYLAVTDKNNIWVTKSKNRLEMYPHKWDPASKQWIQKGNIDTLTLAAGKDGTILVQDFNNKIYKWVE